MNDNIQKYREELNKIDIAILDLLVERSAIVHKVGQEKNYIQEERKKNNQTKISYTVPTREVDMINKLIKYYNNSNKFCNNKLNAQLVINLWRTIIVTSLLIEENFTLGLYIANNNADNQKLYLKYKILIDRYFLNMPELVIYNDLEELLRDIQVGKISIGIGAIQDIDLIVSNLLDSDIHIYGILPHYKFIKEKEELYNIDNINLLLFSQLEEQEYKVKLVRLAYKEEYQHKIEEFLIELTDNIEIIKKLEQKDSKIIYLKVKEYLNYKDISKKLNKNNQYWTDEIVATVWEEINI